MAKGLWPMATYGLWLKAYGLWLKAESLKQKTGGLEEDRLSSASVLMDDLFLFALFIRDMNDGSVHGT